MVRSWAEEGGGGRDRDRGLLWALSKWLYAAVVTLPAKNWRN